MPDYSTNNPIAKRLVRGYLTAVSELVAQSGAIKVFEVGCGEGQLTVAMARMGLAVRACDSSGDAVRATQKALKAEGLEADIFVANVYDLDTGTGTAELVVCCEVLEHLERPDKALSILQSLASPNLLVSVPREPLWRFLNMCRGKFIRDFGNTPDHIQHWSQRSFLDFLKDDLRIVAMRSPIPWTMVLCRTQ